MNPGSLAPGTARKCHLPLRSEISLTNFFSSTPLLEERHIAKLQPIYAMGRLPQGGFHCCISLQASWYYLILETKTKYYFDETEAKRNTKKKRIQTMGYQSCQQTNYANTAETGKAPGGGDPV